jgi:hypothetical protein
VGLVFAGWALLAAPDYFLASGAGRNSGFDPVAHWQAGEFLALTAKWSSYLYYPLWSIPMVALGIWYLIFLLKPSRWQRWIIASVLLLACFDLGDYIFSAALTYRYNNPDYIVWHVRSEFWVLWPSIIILASWRSFYQLRKDKKTSGELKLKSAFLRLAQPLLLVLFVGGFVAPTVFDWSLPGIGVQWWALLIILFMSQTTTLRTT